MGTLSQSQMRVIPVWTWTQSYSFFVLRPFDLGWDRIAPVWCRATGGFYHLSGGSTITDSFPLHVWCFQSHREGWSAVICSQSWDLIVNIPVRRQEARQGTLSVSTHSASCTVLQHPPCASHLWWCTEDAYWPAYWGDQGGRGGRCISHSRTVVKDARRWLENASNVRSCVCSEHFVKLAYCGIVYRTPDCPPPPPPGLHLSDCEATQVTLHRLGWLMKMYFLPQSFLSAQHSWTEELIAT